MRNIQALISSPGWEELKKEIEVLKGRTEKEVLTNFNLTLEENNRGKMWIAIYDEIMALPQQLIDVGSFSEVEY